MSASPTRAGGSGVATWAIVAAAGSGERLGGDLPKAFVPFGDRVLLAESLERLDRCDWIDAIVVVVASGWEEAAIVLAEEIVASKVSAVVAGGTTRAESVRIGLDEVPDDALVVVVHDAARPLVTDAIVESVLVPLGEGFDGVVPVLPLADTVKRVEEDVVTETLDRAGLVVVQTPQAFVADALRSAHAGDLDDATDCASLVERRGGRIRTVPGDPRLAKITTRADLELLASWL